MYFEENIELLAYFVVKIAEVFVVQSVEECVVGENRSEEDGCNGTQLHSGHIERSGKRSADIGLRVERTDSSVRSEVSVAEKRSRKVAQVDIEKQIYAQQSDW